MIELAIKDLKEHRVRTLLTALGIFTAIAAIVSLGSISAGVNEMITSSTSLMGSNTIFVMKNFDLSEMMSGPPGSTVLESIKEDEIDSLRNIQGVKRAVPVISKMVSGMFAEVDGINMDDRDIFGAKDVQFDEGGWPDNEDKGAAIGYFVAKSMKVGIGDYIKLNGYDVEVMGVLKEGSGSYDMVIAIPYVYAGEIYDMPGEANQVLIEPEGASQIDDIKNTIIEEHDTLTVYTVKDAVSRAQESMATLNIMTYGIGFIASIVAAIGIIITMYTSVMERRRQMGIMKAIGAERRVILKQILEEGIIVSVISSAAAVAISYVMVDIMNAALFGGARLAIVTPALAAGGIAYGVIITIIFSLYPAWVAINTDPIDAIRNG
jgi:putative ABC transport system permease protein